ncbi:MULTISPECIES: hypothetical protein [unclassified Streptomyces]|uniref:hypothetical protein n=1 Tax=unclassified Streptomyces TaxID=2593676 RepID=UPI00081DA911|nr:MULTISPECIES: hypothetical protein [unclassified Streptomyces]MYR26774.1 WD40 repeat domain-containing protein [Streptomyces sp. SID4945]SCF10767.1 hypothetical protein GA0115257_106940 [Streptomyces sp. LcepLS]
MTGPRRRRPLPPARRPRARSLAPLAAVTALCGGLLLGPGAPAYAADDHPAFTIRDARVTESSGLAASRLHPGVYWTHNDSDDGPYLYAIDGRSGRTLARITLSGIGSPRDVEAISLGPDGRLYVGDIGDNLDGTWPHVWIYALPEPKQLRDQIVRATQYTVQYEGGPRNAEALMVHPKTGRVYIASKRESGGNLYEGPAKLSATGTNVFRKVAPVDLWVTDGAFSPDGRTLALRGYFSGTYYDWNDGHPKAAGRLAVPLQRQGESLTWTTDGTTLMYGSEGSRSEVRPEEAPVQPSPSPGASKSAPGSGKGSGEGGQQQGDGADSGRSGAGQENGDKDGAGKDTGGTTGKTVLVVVLAAAVLYGLRRTRGKRAGK